MSAAKTERRGQVEEATLESIEMIFEYLELRRTSTRWFRGVSSNLYYLEPSIFRLNAQRRRLSKLQEKLLCNRFNDGTSQLIHRHSDDELNLLLLMQHYGLPTRLLDWTDSFTVALSFALEEKQNLPTIWLIEPKRLNASNSIFGREKVPNSQDVMPRKYGKIAFLSKLTAEHHKCKHPLAFKPLYPDQRVLNQRGRFTIHGSLEAPLDDQLAGMAERGDPIICKMVLKLGQIQRRRIEVVKLHNSVLYPDRDGLIRRLREQMASDPKLKPNEK